MKGLEVIVLEARIDAGSSETRLEHQFPISELRYGIDNERHNFAKAVTVQSQI